MPEPPLDAAGSISIVEGAVDIILDGEAGERCRSLQPGQAFVVPRGWGTNKAAKGNPRFFLFAAG